MLPINKKIVCIICPEYYNLFLTLYITKLKYVFLYNKKVYCTCGHQRARELQQSRHLLNGKSYDTRITVSVQIMTYEDV